MRFALSTNWNNGRLADGSAIVDEALALGFDALELGFRTTPEQMAGFRRRLDELPVDSVHAYCPVPVGAPSGHPELHQLADPDEDERALARLLLKDTLACAQELGAKVVVTHAGYVELDGWFVNRGSDALREVVLGPDGEPAPASVRYQKFLAKARARRDERGVKLRDTFLRELDLVIPALEKAGVTLALENLPSLEGFPNAEEAEKLMADLAGAPVKLWFDTGHARVRECYGWSARATEIATRVGPHICGMHLNDVENFHDDHRQPGWGKVDFAALMPLARRDILRVFEPHQPVTFDELKASLAQIRRLWAELPPPADSRIPQPETASHLKEASTMITDVTVLIPAYQPDDKLTALVDRLRAEFAHVVVVDDGSTEGRAVFEAIRPKVDAVLVHEQNRGKGAALKTGFAWIRDHQADSLGVVTADADGQHKVEDIRRVAEALGHQTDGLVLGVRHFGLKVPFRSRLGNHWTTAFFWLLTGLAIKDTQTGLRGVPRALLDRVLALGGDRYEYEMRMLVDARLHRQKPLQLPIETVYIDGNKSSHFHPLRDTFLTQRALLSARFGQAGR